jgi:hypothetical protein
VYFLNQKKKYFSSAENNFQKKTKFSSAENNFYKKKSEKIFIKNIIITKNNVILL